MPLIRGGRPLESRDIEEMTVRAKASVRVVAVAEDVAVSGFGLVHPITLVARMGP